VPRAHVRKLSPRRSIIRRRPVATAAVAGLTVVGSGLIWLGAGAASGAGVWPPTNVAYRWTHRTESRPAPGRPGGPHGPWHPPRTGGHPSTTSAPGTPGTSTTPPATTSTSTTGPTSTSTSTTAAPTSTGTTTSTSAPAPTTTSTTSTSSAAAGSYSCVQTTAHGRCYFPGDPAVVGANGQPYLDQNVWAADGSTYKQSLHGAGPQDWYITAQANTNFGGVLTYPNVGFDMAGTVDSKPSTTSSWGTEIPHDAKTAAWAAYDLWFNNWADEVMIQTDIAANSYYTCQAVATAVFDGNPWHMCRFGAERVWKPGTDDAHLQNRTAGSLNIKAVLTWMEQNGQLPAGSTWTAASFGFEVCDTGGVVQKLSVNKFTWSSK